MKKITSVCLVFFIVLTFLAGTALAAPPEYTGSMKDSLAVLLIDADSGKVLFEQNADERVKPASTTKILTTIVALENSTMDEEVIVTSAGDWSNKPAGYSLLGTRKDEKIRMKDLLYGMMLVSGDDAACAIAVHVGKKVDTDNPMDAFVDMMNSKAQEIGMTSSHFANPGGVEDEELYVTARDMAKLAIHAMNNPDFRDIVKTTSYDLPKTNRNNARTIKNTNYLLLSDNEYYYQYATGIKTGRTSAAGGSLVSSATKDGMNLICLVFNDKTTDRTDRWPISKDLFEWGFDNWKTIDVTSLLKPVEPVQISDFDADDANNGLLEFKQPEISTIYATLPKEEAQALLDGTDTIDTVPTIDKDLVAPIAEGDIMGTVKYTIKSTGEEIRSYPLIAARNILEEDSSGGTVVATLPPTPPIAVVPKNDNNPLFIVFLIAIPGGLIVFLVVRMITARRSRHFSKRRRPHYSYRK